MQPGQRQLLCATSAAGLRQPSSPLPPRQAPPSWLPPRRRLLPLLRVWSCATGNPRCLMVEVVRVRTTDQFLTPSRIGTTPPWCSGTPFPSMLPLPWRPCSGCARPCISHVRHQPAVSYACLADLMLRLSRIRSILQASCCTGYHRWAYACLSG